MVRNIGILIFLMLISFIPALCFSDVAYPAGTNRGDVLTGLGTLFIFLIIPLVLPVWVIYFIRKKKTIFKLK
jgi:hypothetical protein